MSRSILVFALALIAASALRAADFVVDPASPYYQGRTEESVASELAAAGCRSVHLVHRHGADLAELVEAFKTAGIKVWLLSDLTSLDQGEDLPEQSASWRMKTINQPDDAPAHFCPNNPAYRRWIKAHVIQALGSGPFSGVNLAEAFFPGSEDIPAEPYGCLCEHCTAAFKKMYPDVSGPPQFTDPQSPQYWKTDAQLYEKWTAFRAFSVVEFLDDLVNGAGGIRETRPGISIAVSCPVLVQADGPEKLRMWNGVDVDAVVKRVRPDVLVLQTHKTDWSKPDLKPDYPLAFHSTVTTIGETSAGLSVILQADIGSSAETRRSEMWMTDAAESAAKAGFDSTVFYEYHLGDYIYTAPLRVAAASADTDTVKLVFNKRVDPASASSIGNYELPSGSVDYARVDGNTVTLSVSGADPVAAVAISGLSDDESARHFHDRPACAMQDTVQVSVQ